MSITITGTDFLAILPVVVLSAFGIYLMLQGVLAPRINRRVLVYLGLLGVVAALGSNIYVARLGISGTFFDDMVRVDRLTVVLNYIFLATAALCLLMADGYSRQESLEFIEFVPLVLFSTVGMMLMGMAESLMIIFLGLETMSIALYVLAAFRRFNRRSLEAGLKYFLLGAFATGFLLYGIALLYGSAGTTNLADLTKYFETNLLDLDVLALIGLALIIIGFAFKVALVPFHMWTPDVYQGAPIPVTAYMAVGAKAAGFAAILRVIYQAAGPIAFQWTQVLWVLAVLTMTVGNIIALAQNDIKRMLAYSSIAHAGYILMGVIAANDLTVTSVVFYLIVYLFMNVGAFAVAEIVGGEGESRVQIQHFAGLGKTHPFLGIAMTVFMFSLAGFPPTGGFMGKLNLFSAALQSGFIWLVIFGAINTLLSVYYYIGVVIAMYMKEPDETHTVAPVWPGMGLVIAISVVGTFLLGILPGRLLSLIY
ncbi:MAG: NADH-quinone oxidoreductase subunit N [Calditrichaeota bacterium]|nr:MAG: NADH-quinone oxidoreductase subunit N [Calditrichota bacterium]